MAKWKCLHGEFTQNICVTFGQVMYSHGTKSLVLTKLNFIILFPQCQCFTGLVKAEDGKSLPGLCHVRRECCRSWCNQIRLKTLTGGFMKGLGLKLTEQTWTASGICSRTTQKGREKWKTVSLQAIIWRKSQQGSREQRSSNCGHWDDPVSVYENSPVLQHCTHADLPLCFHIDSNNSKPKPSAAWCHFTLITFSWSSWFLVTLCSTKRNDFRVLLTDINSDFSLLCHVIFPHLISKGCSENDWLI